MKTKATWSLKWNRIQLAFFFRQVVCTFCSDYKAPLRYLEYKAARVCMDCYDVLEKGKQSLESW